MPIPCYLHKGSDLRRAFEGEDLNAVSRRALLTYFQSIDAESGEIQAVVFDGSDAQHRQHALPDVLLFSEYGIGLLDLCHESGTIFRDEDVWYADGKLVRGNRHSGARNPHEQIQRCAERVRLHLMTAPRDSAPWLPGRYLTWQDLIFDTAICFTRPDAAFRHAGASEPAQRWERFRVFKLTDLPQWAAHLNFEPNLEDRGSVQSYRLPKRSTQRILHELFEAQEIPLQPQPQPQPASRNAAPRPYGYLLLKRHNDILARFALDHEKMTVGRESSCDVLLPNEYRMVSRIHADLTCSPTGVIIKDVSRNGVFIEGHRITQSARLAPGQHILLGGNRPVEGVCQLEFSVNPAASS